MIVTEKPIELIPFCFCTTRTDMQSRYGLINILQNTFGFLVINYFQKSTFVNKVEPYTHA